MAHICFAWELGQGYGHLVRYRSLIERLLGCGHAVSFIVKDAARAERVFSDLDVHLVAVEPGFTPPQARLVRLNSYADILHDFGFNTAAQLQRQLEPWLAHIDRLGPDILIADHSPTALIAARIRGLRVISSGNGFTVPPRVTPMRPLRYWNPRGREQLAAHEQLVLTSCNAVLRRHGATELDVLARLLEADCEWLLSFPELDHYGERDGARYLGNFPATGFGREPRWQPVDGPKVFAYLSTPTVSDALLEALRAVEANLSVHAPQLDGAARARFDPSRTVIEPVPVDIEAVARDAEVVVTNGSLNSVSAFLAAGMPQLALPNNLERHMVGRRLELLGAGLMAPWREARHLPEKMRAVTRDRAFARAAEVFATRHAADNALQQTATMLADVNRLLSR